MEVDLSTREKKAKLKKQLMDMEFNEELIDLAVQVNETEEEAINR